MPLLAKPDRVSRGLRVKALQEAVLGAGDTNAPFVRLLNAAASDLGLKRPWDNSRLSRVRSGSQDLSVDDVATLITVARSHGAGGNYEDWCWVAFELAESAVRRAGEPSAPLSGGIPAEKPTTKKERRASA